MKIEPADVTTTVLSMSSHGERYMTMTVLRNCRSIIKLQRQLHRSQSIKFFQKNATTTVLSSSRRGEDYMTTTVSYQTVIVL